MKKYNKDKFKHVYSLSGGQDSTAMVVRALELGYPVDYIIFCDTGNEFPQMYKYLHALDEWLLKKYKIGITRLSSDETLETLCFSPFKKGKNKGQIRGLPYASSMSFCTIELKKNIARKFSKKIGGAYMYLGYVFHEKDRKHNSLEKYIINRYPLIDWKWNEDKVSLYIKSIGIYNNLYDFYSRTGCMYCPKQTINSWKALYVNFPNKYNEAVRWEQRATKLNAHIKTFRSDYSLTDLSFRFERELQKERKQIKFQFDWNDENISCFCK
jgi:3'-phosphoadenosine 5'-phosphosulfate sulfotransferase (PAPS reductase)/FAD synthetase